MTFTYKHRQSMSILEFSLLVTVPLLTPAHLAGRAPVCAGQVERSETPNDHLQAFMGTWCGQQNGQRAVTLTLKNEGTEFTGSIIFYLYQDGKLVDQNEVQLLTPKLQADTLNFSLQHARMCGSCHYGASRQIPLQSGGRLKGLPEFEMRLLGEDQAQLKTLGVAESEFSLQRLSRQR